MAVIKEMKFRISSVIENLSPAGLVEGEAEVTESFPSGFFKINGDEYSISYSEQSEGTRTVSDIQVSGERVCVRRVGAIESNMIFEVGVPYKSLYTVAGYSFDSEIRTKKIRNNLTRSGGRVDIYYEMTIGGAQKNVRMKIECL